MTVTLIIKPEHTHWCCKKVIDQKTRKRCNTRHPMSRTMCNVCNNHRKVDTEAEDTSGNTLGVLVAFSDSTELWSYTS